MRSVMGRQARPNLSDRFGGILVHPPFLVWAVVPGLSVVSSLFSSKPLVAYRKNRPTPSRRDLVSLVVQPVIVWPAIRSCGKRNAATIVHLWDSLLFAAPAAHPGPPLDMFRTPSYALQSTSADGLALVSADVPRGEQRPRVSSVRPGRRWIHGVVTRRQTAEKKSKTQTDRAP